MSRKAMVCAYLPSAINLRPIHLIPSKAISIIMAVVALLMTFGHSRDPLIHGLHRESRGLILHGLLHPDDCNTQS